MSKQETPIVPPDEPAEEKPAVEGETKPSATKVSDPKEEARRRSRADLERKRRMHGKR